MKRIRIAQIGTSANSHGNEIWQSLLKQDDIFEIVGYALPEREREKMPNQTKAFKLSREMTVDEILSDPTIEAVAIETEEIYLTKYALMAAKAGKHVHMEKPGGLDLAAFEELVKTLRDKNLVFSLGYMYRFNPKVREALEKVKCGELGKIYSVEAQMNCYHVPELRKWLKGFPGGMMFFLGCHLIDLIYQIQGEPDEVIPLSTSTGIDGLDSEDLGMAVFKYKDGVSFAKACDDERGGYSRRQLVICGEKGTIEIRPLEMVYKNSGQYTVSRENYSDRWLEPWEESQSEVFDRYDGMMRNFAEMVRGKENPYGYDYELNLYKLVLRACRGIK
jgi:predicted dehydrogenase